MGVLVLNLVFHTLCGRSGEHSAVKGPAETPMVGSRILFRQLPEHSGF